MFGQSGLSRLVCLLNALAGELVLDVYPVIRGFQMVDDMNQGYQVQTHEPVCFMFIVVHHDPAGGRHVQPGDDAFSGVLDRITQIQVLEQRRDFGDAREHVQSGQLLSGAKIEPGKRRPCEGNQAQNLVHMVAHKQTGKKTEEKEKQIDGIHRKTPFRWLSLLGCGLRFVRGRELVQYPVAVAFRAGSQVGGFLVVQAGGACLGFGHDERLLS